jgi:excisionase family DNA binding protein
MLATGERFPRRLIAERRIRFVRVGRHVRIPESALREFIAAGLVEPMPHQTFRSKTAADRWLTTKEAEILAGDWLDPDAGRVAFAATPPRGSRNGPACDPARSGPTTASCGGT